MNTLPRLKEQLSIYERAVKSRENDIEYEKKTVAKYKIIIADLKEQIKQIETGQNKLF